MQRMRTRNFVATSVTLTLVLAVTANVRAAGEKTFPSTEAAAAALVAAASADDSAALQEIFGPDSHDLFFSGDDVADKRALANFAAWAAESTELNERADGSVEMVVGDEEWPLPMPLVKDADGWHFDTAAGKNELINRRIGANELSAIDIVHGFVDAELAYAGTDHDGDGVKEFAQRILSDDGKMNGLYWTAEKHGGQLSPIGPLVATASEEGYVRSTEEARRSPYHGYYFRILKKQGSHAPGGKKSYMVGDSMTGGFAVIAFPAEYGVSGIMTMVVGRNDILFQKDLGPNTDKVAPTIDTFDPDDSWTVVKDE